MIIARATSGSGEFLIIGLSRDNINRLVDGNPIQTTPKAHGDGIPEGWSILLMFGETEADIHRELAGAGMIDDNTKVIVDPRLKL